jgi:glycosyltransferase involved in cell wall biosynthesis
MKLCFLAAGNSVHSHRWIRFFAEKGHEIHWISLTPLEFPELRGVHFHDRSARTKWISLAKAALRIRGIVRDIAPDIVHAHYAGSYGLLGAMSGFQPFVISAWGSDILFAGKAPLRGRLVRWALGKARLITCDAHHMIEAMRGLGTDVRKIRMICFGVEVDRFAPGAKDPGILERWGVQASPERIVISLRNLEPVYDIGTLLEAAPLVLREFPAARFVIAGAGSCERSLKDQADRLGIAGSLRFLGRYAHAELPLMLRSADVYVSTSLSDAGIAASTAEAMACAVPVVVSDTGENNKWIEDGRSGCLFGARDPKALAGHLLSLLESDQLRRRMGEAGRAVILERNCYENEMAKMEHLYQSLRAGDFAPSDDS